VAGAAAGPRDREVGLGPPVDGQRAWATAGLLGVALVWGTTFSAVKDALDAMPATDFLAIRFTVATAVMLALRPGTLRHLDRNSLRDGVGLGVLLGGGYLAQTVGLERITPGVSGVLAGLVVVLAAVVAVAFRLIHTTRWVWSALGLGGLAVAVLALPDDGLGAGEALTVLAALVLAGHLVAFARRSDVHDLWTLTVVQLLTAATILAVLAAPGGITTPPDLGVWVDVAIAAVLAMAVSYVVQTWAQRRLSPTRVGVLLAAEPAFAVLVAVLVADEVLSWQLLLAGALVIASMIVSELGSHRDDPVAAA
jgi:drug/metabolite transporter (DMT)-like permease